MFTIRKVEKAADTITDLHSYPTFREAADALYSLAESIGEPVCITSSGDPMIFHGDAVFGIMTNP